MENYPDEEHVVKILDTKNVTHNVKRFTLSKPENYLFTPGQATDIVINLPEWKNERRPFTFTCLNDWNTLEFTIKIYDDHNGVTNELGKLKAGDELIVHDVFGAIHYKGEGIFVAGGAGVTPFIAIFRDLNEKGKIGNNKLIFSNRTTEDIILKDEFEKMLGDNFINTITEEKSSEYDNERIDESYLSKKITDFNKYFYICGPDPMVEAIQKDLLNLGVKEEMIVVEQF
ncbi:MAG TPA: FAD-binding oxidoreductase [Hanamia sp.]|nr:FAD-binding oxidoreductase [Hanamia sp.]